ncbi:XRE family transcriptional regulator [Bacillus methanolicus]|uniref:helix-turn-helix domain-containing protein n=1 Tax=Bacillus methanolicus TaxID=1471 RepID=UPI002A3AE6FC|nr:XRE family transcriptional regulator [Bacillus methanolicus]
MRKRCSRTLKIFLKDSRQFKIMLIERGFSQRQFSKRIGTSETYLNQIINNKKSPSPAIAKKIVDQLEVEFQDIFTIQ